MRTYVRTYGRTDGRTDEPDNYNDQRHRPNGVDLVQYIFFIRIDVQFNQIRTDIKSYFTLVGKFSQDSKKKHESPKSDVFLQYSFLCFFLLPALINI